MKDQSNTPLSLPSPILHHAMRRFIVTYNNRKKHGAYPVKTFTDEGCVGSSGYTALFTSTFHQRGFARLSEMTDVLENFGDVSVYWIDPEPQKGRMERLSHPARKAVYHALQESLQSSTLPGFLLNEQLADTDYQSALEEIKRLIDALLPKEEYS